MKEQVLPLKGKVALITGSAKGIGRAIALSYARNGADVAICDVEVMTPQLESVAAEISGLGCRVAAIQADISRKSDVDRLAQRVVDQFGTIDILVNNAGILIRASLLSISESDWDQMMAVDLKGCFLCCQAIGKIMVQRKSGTIINISTQHAYKAFMNDFGPYGVAKAGVLMLTRYLAKELGEHGIRVNGIAPGITRTDFSKMTWSDPAVLKSVEAALPMKRMAEVDDITDTALFLASDGSKYMTGHTIVLDGGSLA